MSQVFLIPRHCMGWLLFAQVVLLMPHAERLPVWILGAWLIAALWRLMIFQGRWSYPGLFIKVVLVALASVGVVTGYRVKYGLEPAVALLLSGFALKLLEMKNRRDVLVTLYLAFFVAPLQMLFSQTLGAMLYMLASLVIVTTALIALHQAAFTVQWYKPLRKAMVMHLQSMPLLLALFLVMPRLPPFWSVPMPSNASKTGMGSSMEPGNVTKLAKSDALAFRAIFKQPIPPNALLYWRGLTLSAFDGRRWEAYDYALFDRPFASMDVATQARPVQYSLVIEPTQQPWIFAIAAATAADARVRYDRDFNLSYNQPIQTRFRLEVESQVRARLEPDLAALDRIRETALPQSRNPKTIAQAKQWRQRVVDDAAYIDFVLNYFHQEQFFYTLEPDRLGYDSVDDFLFRSRRGFCEHYASAFVVLMRAAGIPARVVVGYQGGSRNEPERYVTVRQLDAHAWAEVWLPGRGWKLVDPTSAVAPQRIENGMSALQDEQGYLADSPFSPMRYSGINWLAELQTRYDYMNYLWHQWVLGYDRERQAQALKDLLGEVTAKRIALLLLLMGGASVLLVLAGFWWRAPRRREHPALKVLRKFELKIKRRLGITRMQNEGISDFSRRIVQQRPDLRKLIENIDRNFNELLYDPRFEDKARLRQLRQEIRLMRIPRPRLR